MRNLALIPLAILYVACKAPNPEFCCVTEQDCNAAGVEGLRPCGPGQACRSNVCVAAECQTSADCTSLEAPTCLHNLCTSGCEVDDDCVGIAGAPHCALDRVCVGCVSNQQCSSNAPICDGDARSCRGCDSDDECGGGVCVEADGVCANDSEILYVTMSGVDSGECTSAAPCRTLEFAQATATAQRRIIRLLGGMYDAGNTPITFTSGGVDALVVDGNDTTVRSTAVPVLSVQARATLEDVRFAAALDYTPLISVGVGGKLRLAQVTLDGIVINVDKGAVTLSDAKLSNSRVLCTNGGPVFIVSSLFDHSTIETGCDLDLSRSRLGPGFGTLIVGGGLAIVENNVFLEVSQAGETIRLEGGSPGGRLRFNTIVNSSATANATAILCYASTIDISNNIVAFNSIDPISAMCSPPRYTLFDVAAAAEVSSGPQNVAGNAATFFRDRAAGDFHLTATSPARGIAEASSPPIDLDGKPRPLPTGSKPDVGAFEAP